MFSDILNDVFGHLGSSPFYDIFSLGLGLIFVDGIIYLLTGAVINFFKK